tara:strand:+ start:170 stop:307 length:138 start_codon:yes stop_codon:yes gene_type:complete
MGDFTGFRWWDQKNPAYRESCKKQASRETIELKSNYDYFITKTNQ